MIAGSYPPDIKGGGEISTAILAQILIDGGCDVRVLTCGSQDSYTLDDGVAVTRTVSPNVYWDYAGKHSLLKKVEWHFRENLNSRARTRIKAFINEIKPDLLLTSTIENFGGEPWNAAHDLGVPSVHILRSYYSLCFRGAMRKKGANCQGQCIECSVLSAGRRYASQSVSGVVGISDYILNEHKVNGFFSNAATVVIGEPIAKNLFENKRNPEQRTRFGYLGILSADKGLDSLAAAWSLSELTGCSLSVAGTGTDSYTARLRSLFSEDVRLLGWVDSSKFLKDLDFLIVPSVWHEPFGRVVIEAFAKGIPVIGSRIGGIAETVIDGHNGFTFTPGDSNELSQLLIHCSQITREDYISLSENARQDVELFEAKHIAAAHIAFYDATVNSYKRKH